MRIITYTLLLFLLSSCSKNWVPIVIQEKWDPIDYHMAQVYPIKDTMSCAIGFYRLNSPDSSFYFYRDRDCKIESEYGIGDTVFIPYQKIFLKYDKPNQETTKQLGKK